MFKGKIKKIESIDSKGNISVILEDKHNMVTNSHESLFNQNYMPDALLNKENKVLNMYTPIKDLFMGLLLFKHEIEETNERILPNSKDFENFVGCCGGFYDGNDIYRGSLNSDLTKIENEEMDLVFDFGLPKINNKIKTICLTSYSGGISGLNKTNDANVVSSFLSAYKEQDLRNGNCIGGCGTIEGGGVCSTNFIPLVSKSKDGFLIGANKDGILFTCLKNEDDTITLNAFSYLNDLGFTDTVVNFSNAEEFETKCNGEIERTKLFKKIASTTFEVSLSNAKNLFVNDNHIYLAIEESIGNYSVYDFLFSSYNENFSYEHKVIGTNCNVNLNNIKTNGNNLYGFYTNENTKYLYVVNLNNGEYKRIEVINEDMDIINYLDTIMIGNIGPTENVETIRTFYVYSFGGNLCPITIRFNNKSDCPIFGFCDCFNSPVVGTISEFGDYTTINMNVVTPYKSTINVLTSAITKGTTNCIRVTYNLKCE